MLFTGLRAVVGVCEVKSFSQHRSRPDTELLDSYHVYVGSEPRRQRSKPAESAELSELRLHLRGVFHPDDREATRVAPTPAALAEIRLLRPGETPNCSPPSLAPTRGRAVFMSCSWDVSLARGTFFLQLGPLFSAHQFRPSSYRQAPRCTPSTSLSRSYRCSSSS